MSPQHLEHRRRNVTAYTATFTPALLRPSTLSASSASFCKQSRRSVQFRHARTAPSKSVRTRISLATELPSLTSNTEVPRDPHECAQNFLTQRAVQQTIFCAFILRDETNARWLEAFLNHTGLYDLHACNALRLPGKDYLLRLFRAPPETLKIHKPIQGRTNNKNPYIKRRYFTYEVGVSPRKIARRILEVRVEIADELIDDLKCIPADNERLKAQQRRLAVTKKTGANTDLPPTANRGGSPYRVATFDLAKNYTLYLSLLSTSRQLQNKPTGDSKWIRDMSEKYASNLLAPPGGEQNISDRVVSEIFAEVPSINAQGRLFDPIALGTRVLDEREECANKWIKYLEGVREEHLELEKLVLESDI